MDTADKSWGILVTNQWYTNDWQENWKMIALKLYLNIDMLPMQKKVSNGHIK